MSQSIGIHLGEHTFHLVALDGGLRKHKVVCAESGDILGADGAAEAVTERLQEIVKKNKLSLENVHLAVDSGVAAFRNLTLPFDDREKIEEVLKFEVEGNLPQFDIDEVVVDFLTLSSKPGVESKLLVTAVPKERLGNALALCERAGVEPLEIELEGTALFDAALEGGVLEEDSAALLLHVGDTSTTVVVADGHRLAGIRAIRLGARTHRLPGAAEDEPTEVDLLPEAEVGQPEVAPPDLAQSELAAEERVAASVQRIRRELVRTLSAARTVNEIHTIHVCGQELPGLIGEEIEGVPVEAMPFEPGETTLGREFVVAYGAALRGFDGGVLKPHLRREDLRFTGRFERLELPLAVFALLLFTLLFVQYIVLEKQLEWRDEGNLAKDVRGDMQIWLEESNRNLLPDPNNPRPVRLPDPPQSLADYARNAERGADKLRTKFEEIQHVHRLLLDNIRSLERELGQDTDTKQPQSALTAATLVMQQIAGMGKDVRIGIRRFESAYQHNARGDYVVVNLDCDFFGENSLEATRNYNELETRFEARPWCQSFEGKSTKALDGDKGIQVDGITIQIDVDKALEEQVGGQS